MRASMAVVVLALAGCTHFSLELDPLTPRPAKGGTSGTYMGDGFQIDWTLHRAGTLGLSKAERKAVRFDDEGDWFVVFVLRNTGDENLTLLWDRCAYVDPSGESHRLVPRARKAVRADESHPPINVPPGAKVSDWITPADGVRFVEAENPKEKGHWVVRGLFYAGTEPKLEGEKVTFAFAVERGGKVETANLVFRIALLTEKRGEVTRSKSPED